MNTPITASYCSLDQFCAPTNAHLVRALFDLGKVEFNSTGYDGVLTVHIFPDTIESRVIAKELLLPLGFQKIDEVCST